MVNLVGRGYRNEGVAIIGGDGDGLRALAAGVCGGRGCDGRGHLWVRGKLRETLREP